MKASKVHQATVLGCRPERKGSEAILLRLKLDNDNKFKAGAGQFIALPPADSSSVMPRPFTIVDTKGSELSILFRVVGKNTRGYSRLKSGDRIKIIGPQGSKISYDQERGKYIFVGGGIGGVALVFPVKKALDGESKAVTVFLGAKKKSQLAGMGFFKKYGVKPSIITDNGFCRTGFVTELLEEALQDDAGASQVIACGPKAMLQKTFEICKRYGNKCLVIVEEVMACGMGACKSCAIFGGKEGKEVKHVCTDGPAFDAQWIDWPKFMRESAIFSAEDKSRKISPAEVNFSCRLGSLILKYPTIGASGCWDIGAFENGSVSCAKLGAIVAKGLSVKALAGNAMPRICEVPSGLINSIGLEYIGLESFLREALPRFFRLGIPIIANINGKSISEFVILAEALNDTEVAAIEVNISCPNVKEGGMTFGIDPGMSSRITEAVRQASKKFLIVKLTPNVTDIVLIAKAVTYAGADAISLINTVQAMDIDVRTCQPKIARVFGGLSGPAIRAIALAKVRQVYLAKLGLPIIGMGGISDGESAAKFLMAGANAIAFGTAGFANRNLSSQIVNELAEIATFHGYSAINQMVGSMIVPRQE